VAIAPSGAHPLLALPAALAVLAGCAAPSGPAKTAPPTTSASASAPTATATYTTYPKLVEESFVGAHWRRSGLVGERRPGSFAVPEDWDASIDFPGPDAFVVHDTVNLFTGRYRRTGAGFRTTDVSLSRTLAADGE